MRPDSPTRQAVRDYNRKGLTPRQIAQTLGISTQRVYQHLKALEQPPKRKTA